MRFRVSDLAWFVSCPNRSRLQALRKVGKPKYGNPLKIGKEMHWEYSCPYKSFDRRKVRYDLKYGRDDPAFTREVDGHVIAGVYDDLRVLSVYSRGKLVKKVVSFIEVKTTSRSSLWIDQEKVAIFQLQIYLWLLKPYLKKLGYELHSRHYVEAYSQRDGRMMKRIVVRENIYIPFIFKEMFKEWKGRGNPLYSTGGMPPNHPPKWVCKNCPKYVKKECERWQERQRWT